jgi:AraC-like DNA-binding protein
MMAQDDIAGLIQNISVVDDPIFFGDIRYQPGGNLGPRLQRDFQLVILYEGEAVISVDEEEHWLGPGHVALLKPGGRESFQFSRVEVTHHSWCAMHPSRIPADLIAQLTETPPSLPLSSRMTHLIELGLSVPSPDSAASREWLISLGEACLRAYLMESETGGGPPLPEALLRARSIIETRFAEPLSLKILARAVSVSPNHLVRLFQRHLGITPARMLWKCRIRSGMQLLGDTGLTVSEIAYRTGFQNPFHFSRMLKEETGRSPRDFRMERWNLRESESKKEEQGQKSRRRKAF